MNNKIIFLDIDGVLNSMAYFSQLRAEGRKYEKYNEIYDVYLKRLAQIYNKTKASIILSSSWRILDDDSLSKKNQEATSEMYNYLEKTLAKYKMYIEGKTPYVHMERPLEILTWLKDNGMDNSKTRFVSLDDDFSADAYAKYGIEKCLVHTIFFTDDINRGGLQDSHVKKAIEILNGKENIFSN